MCYFFLHQQPNYDIFVKQINILALFRGGQRRATCGAKSPDSFRSTSDSQYKSAAIRIKGANTKMRTYAFLCTKPPETNLQQLANARAACDTAMEAPKIGANKPPLLLSAPHSKKVLLVGGY